MVVDLMYVKPHCLAKSRNFFDVSCGPSSDQNILGTPVRQNDCLTTLMRWGGCGVVTHRDDIGPVRVALHQDWEILSGVRL